MSCTNSDIERGESESSDSLIEMAEIPVKTAANTEELKWLDGLVIQASSEKTRFGNAANSHRTISNNLNLTLLLILAVTSGSNVLYNVFNLTTEDPNFGFTVVTSTLSVLAMIINVVQKVCQYDIKTMNYKMISDQYENFIREQKLNVAQGIDDRREKVTAALSSAESKFSEIQMQAMPL